MMRSLWTAASGMTTQQTNVDVIANNISNINTTGFKRETAHFKTLLYQTIQEEATNNAGQPRPVGIQVGLGVRNSAIKSEYTQGFIEETGNNFDLAIQGEGFFMIQLPDGTTAYTRNGSFGISMGNNGSALVTSEGYPVMDSTGTPIVFDQDMDMTAISIDTDGNIMYSDDFGYGEEITYYLGVQIGRAQFNNPSGLEKMSGSLLQETPASGPARIEGVDPGVDQSIVKSGNLESSNVDAANEMVNLIVAQRAYEMNSKAIRASDEMLQLANNLRG